LTIYRSTILNLYKRLAHRITSNSSYCGPLKSHPYVLEVFQAIVDLSNNE